MKKRATILLFVSGLTGVSLACWLTMFLAGNDVWHFAGSPDFWNGTGAPHTDLRAFAYAFYLQLGVLVTAWLFAFVGFIREIRSTKRT